MTGGGWATARRQRVAALHKPHTTRRRTGAKRGRTGANMQQRLRHSPPFLRFPPDMKSKRFADLPVGALLSHCIFPVRNDVGSALRDDVVVILSIWGKGLGGTGHLGLASVEQIVCPLSGRGKEKERRNDAKKAAHLRGFFPLSAYSSQISAAVTSPGPWSRDRRGWLAGLFQPSK